MKKILAMLAALLVGAGASAATYGPWGESDSVKNPDKLGPTYLMNMPLTINGAAAVQGDCVAVYRQDSSALCGLGKVLDDTGKLTLVCYAPQGTTLHFKVWVASSGTETPTILDCQVTCDLAAPAPGAFHTGHSLAVVEEPEVETKVATPVISPVDGTTFADSCTITITCSTEGASIYYTTNGTLPTATGADLYENPFVAYDACQIVAMAMKLGMVESACVTSSLIRKSSSLASFGKYGPWGDGDAVKNPDKLGPTYLMSMPVDADGTQAAKGDCVAVYRLDTGALCGLGKILDESGKVTVVCYAPASVMLSFKLWVASSGGENPTILDCYPQLAAPTPGTFFSGHALTTTSGPWTITYVDVKGCENINPLSYTMTDAVSFSMLTNPPGWKFLGWSPAKIEKGATGDVTVTAQWEQIKYAVDVDGVIDGDCVYGQSVTAATFAEKIEGYTNIVCCGWVGTGDVPATGVGTQVTFTVTQASSLRWVYETNYWVSVGAVCGDGALGDRALLWEHLSRANRKAI